MTDINRLIEDVNEGEVVMIDFMDGERIGRIERDGEDFELFDIHGCEMCVVDRVHLLKCRVYR